MLRHSRLACHRVGTPPQVRRLGLSTPSERWRAGRETGAVVIDNLIEREGGQRDDVLVVCLRDRRPFGAIGTKSHVAMGEDETTLGLVVLHREDTVHADARARAQAGEESLAACVPEGVAQTLTAILRPHDEKPHETEFAMVGGEGTAADQFATQGRCDEGSRVPAQNSSAS